MIAAGLPHRLPLQAALRRKRVEHVKKRDVYVQYGLQARAVRDALLDKCADERVLSLTDSKVLRIPPFDRLGPDDRRDSDRRERGV